MRNRIARKWWGWIVLVVAAVALLIGGWTIWLRSRPASPARWTALMKAAKTAQGDGRLNEASGLLLQAEGEAARLGAADARLVDTYIARGDLLSAARTKGYTVSLKQATWVPTTWVPTAAHNAEVRFCKGVTPKHIVEAYAHAVHTMESAYAGDDAARLRTCVTLLEALRPLAEQERYKDACASRRYVAGIWLALRERLDGRNSTTLVPVLDIVAAARGAAGDSVGALACRRRQYEIAAVHDPRGEGTNNAYRACYGALLSGGKPLDAADLAARRSDDLAATNAPARERIDPLSDRAYALCEAGQLVESETQFIRAIALCNRVFPKRFFSYPKYSQGVIPWEMHRLYMHYVTLLRRTGREQMAVRAMDILTD